MRDFILLRKYHDVKNAVILLHFYILSKGVAFAVVASFTLIISCTSKHNNAFEPRNYQFVLKDKIKLPLATDVSQNTLSLHSFPAENPDFLFYLHRGLNKASVYDLNSKKLTKKIAWDAEGPDGIGHNAEFCCMVGFDSIFLASVLEQKIFLSDTTSKVKQVFSINFPVTRPTGTYIHQLPGSSLSYKNPFLYFDSFKSFWDDFSTAQGGLRFNLSNHAVEGMVPYPEVYLKGWWDNYHTLSGTVGIGNKDHRLAWFSIDPHVYLIDQRGNVKLKRNLGSEKLKIRPLRNKRPREFLLEEYEDYYSHIVKVGWYASVHYDPLRKLYYRIGFYGSSDKYINFNQIYSKPFVGIFNHDFQKVGEFEIDSRVYNVLFCFIGPKGIYFQNKVDQEREENYLHFDAFQIELDK
jgi:hypothetical protein